MSCDSKTFLFFYDEPEKKLVKLDCMQQKITADLKDTDLSQVIFQKTKSCNKCKIKNLEVSVCLFNSFYCETECYTCPFRSSSKAPKLTSSFLNRINQFEKYVLQNNSIEMIAHSGFGEFFDNNVLMKMYEFYKKIYNKKLWIRTNFEKYDPKFPLDYLSISLNKNTDYSRALTNLQYIPEHMFTADKIDFTVMTDAKYGFTLDDAFNMSTSYINSQKFNIILKQIENTDYVKDTQYYTEDEYNSVARKLKRHKFEVSFESGK